MLRIKFKQDDKQSNYTEINYQYWIMDGHYMTFVTENDHNIKNGDYGKIIGMHRLNNISNEITSEHNFVELVTYQVDGNAREFKVLLPNEYRLYVKYVDESLNGKLIYFTYPHFFNDNDDIMLNMYYVDTNLSITKQIIKLTYDTEFSLRYEGLLPQNYELYRDDFRFKDAYKVVPFVNDGFYNITLPIYEDNAINAQSTDLIKDKFVDEEINKSIPSIIDMEKQCYTPIIGSIKKPLNNIEINLHFREREGADWLIKEDGFWNGYPDGNINTASIRFNDPSRQSDLLGFLGFTNNDIRYQKSKLKKSFVRLLFYDSNNQANQNLLYYSTVFFDSGGQFGKMVKYSDGTYVYPKEDDNGKVIPNEEAYRIGINVSSEPYKYITSNGTEVDMSTKSDSFKEKRRLSTRLTISDKFNSDASSEGFYIYLFAMDDPNLRHESIYLKVEFNHAGYGRTIPFMRPNDYNMDTLNNGKVHSLNKIINDFKDKDKVYDLDTYYNYSYIQFKRGYDKDLGMHVYYLYDETPDDNGNKPIDIENRTLILNLYEAKLKN